MTTYDNYNWRETQPGVWKREADEGEVYHAVLVKAYEETGGIFLAVSLHVSLTIPVREGSGLEETSALFDEALRIAWARLRHEMPTLSSCVVYESTNGRWKKTYESIAGETRRDTWLQETFKTVSNGQTGGQWASTAPPPTQVATLFVVTPPGLFSSEVRRDLVLRVGHDIVDGTGGFQVLNALIHHASQALEEGPGQRLPVFDDSEVARLSPPLRVAVAAPEQLTPELVDRMEVLKTSRLKFVNSPIEKAGIPLLKLGVLGKGKHRRIGHSFSRERTAKLIKALKSVRASPTQAFHGAMAMAVRDLHGEVYPGAEEKQVQWYSHAIRNERPSCIAPYNTRAHSATVYCSGSGLGLPIVMSSLTPKDSKERNQEFARILEEARIFYRAVREDSYQAALAPFIAGITMPKLNLPRTNDPLEWSRLNPLPKLDEKASSVYMSSLGVLDNLIDAQVGRIQADNVWVAGDHLTPDTTLCLGTFKGELNVWMAFNDAWHTEERVETFLNKCVEIVFGWADGLEETK
ncbi:hypothetical protein QBC44DRAFT_349075 [Cladorrhinum sp. PSN332]|nr:hypothetical protein QBC44DRAFT_349075 [Cladorrhinum sp. PSN332]